MTTNQTQTFTPEMMIAGAHMAVEQLDGATATITPTGVTVAEGEARVRLAIAEDRGSRAVTLSAVLYGQDPQFHNHGIWDRSAEAVSEAIMRVLNDFMGRESYLA